MNSKLAIAVCGLVLASFSIEARANPASASKKGAKAVTSARMISELEAVRAQLNKALHDYKGHRADAVHQVTHAIHLLQHGKNHPNPGRHFVPAKAPNEPQAVSDAQLRLALAELQQIAHQLHGSNGQHHAAAATAVKRAIHDLHLALKVA